MDLLAQVNAYLNVVVLAGIIILTRFITNRYVVIDIGIILIILGLLFGWAR